MTLRRSLLAAALSGGLLFTSACSGDDLANDDSSNDSSGGGKVTIASQSFDEAALVTAMYAAILDDLGYDVDTKLVDSRTAYLSEFPGSVDIVPEYVAGLGDQLNTDANGEGAKPISSSDVDATLEAMQPLLDDKGITLLDHSEAASANAFFVSQQYSEDNDVTKLSDLDGQSITLAAAPDCEGRSDCEGGLTDVYGIKITLLPLGYSSPQTYQSVIDGESQLGETGTVDVTLDDQGLVALEDDRGIQPAQNLVPAVSSDFLADHKDIEEPLNNLMAALDTETLGELITKVSVDREAPEDVADEFLTDQGLIG
jgi:osmoprotectant transport system substrate-binding protein